MKDTNIQKYLNDLLQNETNLLAPIFSNGKLEEQYIQLLEIAGLQHQFIKSIYRQKDTKNLSGLRLKFAEFNNSFWRFIFGDIHKIQKREKGHDESIQLNNFKEFCANLVPVNSQNNFDHSGRIFLDVSSTSQLSHITGIQRVATEIVRRLSGAGVYPVIITDTCVFMYKNQYQMIEKVAFGENDTLIMLDIATEYSGALEQVISNIKEVGGTSVAFVYDILPIKFPQFFDSLLVYKFNEWFMRCPLNSDIVICNTDATGVEVKELISTRKIRDISFKNIMTIPLASELSTSDHSQLKENVREIITSHEHIFMSVGTVEPRKGYSIALEAVEAAWKSGGNFIYVIAGRYGWFQNNLSKRISSHPELGKRLFWFSDLNDSDLAILYKNSRALISTSIDEGFGLPLIEAAQHGTPAIVSDIPVFNEIMGDQATYFDVANAEKLTACILSACKRDKVAPRIKTNSWENVTNILIRHIQSL